MHFDIGIVGGGIVGMGAAWAAAKRGLNVAVFEKDVQPTGASIRNFGMVWPIGQPGGPLREMAMASRSLWMDLAKVAGFWLEPCGALHLAHHDDEMSVLKEWFDRDQSQNKAAGIAAAILDRSQTLQQTASANEAGLKGSLWSDSECRVDPMQAVSGTFAYLQSLPNVHVFRQTQIVQADGTGVRSADGRHWTADRVLICGGAEFRNLRPEIYASLPMRRCKLHMLGTESPRDGFQLGPHLASGLTLRHYQSFAGLPSLEDVKQRFADAYPELDRYGIHVMMSQAQSGELVLGDSHQYDDDIPPMNDEVIDQLILQHCQKVFSFPVNKVTKRWTGVYAKHSKAWVASRLEDGIFVLNGFGGAGMTLSLGVADRFVEAILKIEKEHSTCLEIALS